MNKEFSSILNELFSICENKNTGTFFVVSEDNTSCQVVIESGQISKCTFGTKKGFEALSALKHINTEKFSFSSNLLLPMDATANIEYSEDALALLGYANYLKTTETDSFGNDSSIGSTWVGQVARKTVIERKIVSMYRGHPVYKDVEVVVEEVAESKLGNANNSHSFVEDDLVYSDEEGKVKNKKPARIYRGQLVNN